MPHVVTPVRVKDTVFNGVENLQEVENIKLDLPQVLSLLLLTVVKATLIPGAVPRIAHEGYRPDVLHVGSHLIEIVEPPQPGGSFAVPCVDGAGRVDITACKDLVTAAEVVEGFVQQHPVLQSLGGKLARFRVKEFLLNPSQVVGSAFSGIHVGVIARIKNSCPSTVVADEQVEYPGLFVSLLL